MSNERVFIVIEGSDGSGKTSVARIVAERIEAVFYQTPSSFWRDYREIVEGKPVLIRFLYYLLATVWSSAEIAMLLRHGPVVCDRWIYSTWVHHIVYGLRLIKKIPCRYVPLFSIPSHAFLLSVSEEERARRILSRAGNNRRDLDFRSLVQVQNLFTQISDLKEIDTSKMSIMEVAETILENLK